MLTKELFTIVVGIANVGHMIDVLLAVLLHIYTDS